YLRKQGFMALALHGDMPQSVRKRVMNEYKAEPNNLLITTDVAARGIDVKDIIQVINFDLPQNNEYYIHRVGRTGRAGKSGSAYTLLNTPEQIKELQEIEKKTNSKIIASTLSLNGLSNTEKTPAPRSNQRGKKLNIKSREKRAIIAGRTSTNSRSGRNVNIAGGNKLGKKTRTIRQTHKSKKQPKIHY
ncbi:MAG: DEAD/DEAH box helicase, partial [Clostridia bacterium]|nr:DEAD/DEAH box helicase [Clostridia bacterium]